MIPITPSKTKICNICGKKVIKDSYYYYQRSYWETRDFVPICSDCSKILNIGFEELKALIQIKEILEKIFKPKESRKIFNEIRKVYGIRKVKEDFLEALKKNNLSTNSLEKIEPLRTKRDLEKYLESLFFMELNFE